MEIATMRYQGKAQLVQNDQVFDVDADFDYVQDSVDQQLCHRVEGSFIVTLADGDLQPESGDAALRPYVDEVVDKSTGLATRTFTHHAIFVRVGDVIEEFEAEIEKDQGQGLAVTRTAYIWEIFGNSHEQAGFEVPEGVNYLA